MIVVDTSVAVKWAIDETGHADALALLDFDEPRHAPDLLLPELVYVLWKKVVRGEIRAEQARAALEAIKPAIDFYVPSAEIARDALALAEQLDHSTYDCFFLAVAMGRGLLATADLVFAKKCLQGGYGRYVFALGESQSTLVAKLANLNWPSEDASQMANLPAG